ncbi:HAD domain-containing protein [Saccharothrix deserti]|uniref:HAD domain-containing protein n=1 Tax=Saccharothrix deserti TaxID=2593674 RepID=UPI00131AB9A6|nr:HAD domain-containing protein [Saccharothrix deserti]
MRGLLLLDVDGPLNPYAAKTHRRPEGYRTFRYTRRGTWHSGRDARRYKGLRVWLNPDHGAQLRALADDTGLELVWATTWMHLANTLVAPSIGLPELPVIEFPETDFDRDTGWLPDGSWKWRAVAAFAAGRPLAWLDDEHDDGHHEARAWFDRDRADVPTNLCHVDPRHGLWPEHLDGIRAWAATIPR